MKDFLFLMDNWRFKGLRVVSLIAVGAIIGGSLILASQCHAQISPATRPHTHAGASSGGSTLAPSLFTVPGNTPIHFTGNGTREGTLGITGGSLFTLFDLTGTGNVLTIDLVQGDVNIVGSPGGKNGALTSGKSCAANYTRIGPNFCLWSATPQPAPTSVSAGCNTFTVSGAKSLLMQLIIGILSTNVVVNHEVGLDAYSENTCVNAVGNYEATLREQVATAASTQLGQFMVVAPVLAFSGSSFIKCNVFLGGGTCSGSAAIIGYFD